MARGRCNAVLIAVLLGALAWTGVVGAGPNDWLLVEMNTGRILGKADWTTDQLRLRLAGLAAGQEFQLEVLDASGIRILQRSFIALRGGGAKLTIDTGSLARPTTYTLQIRSVTDGVPGPVVARGQGR